MTTHKCIAQVFMEYVYLPDFSAQVWRPTVWSCRVSESDRRIFLCEQEVTVMVPDDFNPVQRQVAALKAEELEVLEEYQNKVAVIRDRLSNLLSITNEVEE